MLRISAVSAVLFLVLASGVAADVAPGPFSSVAKSHWAYKTVERFNCGWCRSVRNWDSARMPFVSRYEFAVLTGRICMEIADSEKARREVTSLQLSGLLRLADEFARELIVVHPDAKALMRGLPSVLSASPPELNLKNCPELAETLRDHWAYEPMKRLYELGILEGRSTQ